MRKQWDESELRDIQENLHILFKNINVMKDKRKKNNKKELF